MANRRSFLQTAFGAGAGLFASRASAERTAHSTNTASQVASRGGYQGNSSGSLSKVDSHSGTVANTPVVTTDIGDLPFEMEGDVKVFRMTAQVVKRQIAPDNGVPGIF
jgi:hypothetical protein